MIRVLAVNETLGYGGAERLLVSLLPALRRIDVEVEILAFWQPYSLGREVQTAGFKVHRGDLSSRFSCLKALRRIRQVWNAGNFDLLWGHNYFGNLYASYFRLLCPRGKIVLTHHNSSFSTEPAKDLWKKIRVGLEVFGGTHLADCTVAVSRSVAKDYERTFVWKNIQVVHNGIPCSDFPQPISDSRRRAIRSDLGFSEKEFLCVTPARFAPEKGHFFLIEAAKRLKCESNWTPIFLLIGSGPLEDEVRKRIEEADLANSFRFLGNKKQPELFQLIQSADAFVLPSLREPFGIAAAEAMTLGCPAVVSKIDGLVELVGNSDSVWFCEPGDSNSIAASLRDLHSQTQRRAEKVERARKHVQENFDVSVVAKAWKKVFSSVAPLTRGRKSV